MTSAIRTDAALRADLIPYSQMARSTPSMRVGCQGGSIFGSALLSIQSPFVKLRPSVWNLFILLLVTIPFLAACGSQPSTLHNPKSLFPDGTTVPQGWARSAEIRTYPPAQLSDYIDGDAEKYLRANVQSTSTADYKFQSKFDAVADIYTFSEPAGATVIFDSEPSAGAATPTVGDSARLYEQSLIYRQGRYLVRIVAYQASPQLQQALLDLGKSIEPRLAP